MAQALPILTFANITAYDENEEGDVKTTRSAPACCFDMKKQVELLKLASDATSSTAEVSDRSDSSVASDSDTESSKPNWVDYATDEEDMYWTQAASPDLQIAAGLSFAKPEEDALLLNQMICPEIQPPATATYRTPLKTGAKDFVPLPQEVRSEFSDATRVDFGKIVAEGLMTMRNSSLVASSEVSESPGAEGWILTCQLRQDVEEQFTGMKTIAEQVQQAMLSAAEVSEKSYILGYEGEPFAPLGLGFQCRLTAVEDETQACWDYIGSGYCCRGYRCRWQHPIHEARVEVRIRLNVI